MHGEYSVYAYGDAALIVETTEEISESAYGRIRGLAAALSADRPDAMRELIPAYRSLLIVYDPLASDFGSMEAEIRSRMGKTADLSASVAEIVRIPVCYEKPYSMDLDDVARHTGLDTDEIIRLHSSGTYLVYMLGFTPGFPYLGGMNERIAAPRRESPRTKIPAGSVGIADKQTGIYPMESPGGWNIIGRTPAILFDHTRQPPTLVRAGQYIRFFPIPSSRFEEIARAAVRREWLPEVERTSGGAT